MPKITQTVAPSATTAAHINREKLRGVVKSGSNRFFAQLTLNGRRKKFGPFKNERDAAKEYDKQALELFKGRARLNYGVNPLKKTENKRGVMTSIVQRKIANSQSWKCNLCKEQLDPNFQIDHAVPLFLNGSDDIDNMQALCCSCHQFKTEFLDRRVIKEMINNGKYVDKTVVEELQNIHKNKLVNKFTVAEKTVAEKTVEKPIAEKMADKPAEKCIEFSINGIKICIST